MHFIQLVVFRFCDLCGAGVYEVYGIDADANAQKWVSDPASCVQEVDSRYTESHYAHSAYNAFWS